MDESRIKEHMKVVGSDGQHVGTVDCLKGDKVVLTKSDPASGGSHHSIPLDWVSSVDEGKVRLNQTTELAKKNWFDAEPEGQTDSKPCP